ncbi:alpha/beta hydrolase [Paenibacillus psychroresistens]|uniref:Alpha/beta hydrolase n=1 Tax=Paenibacillus psychroresistens TaxID=1778678 RepID=A0A6B8RUP3_9BACL|nr:alpha/beta hydrolase [Paenibacillus psychroresistens]QGQ99345.1 alpha/beta hydrolase [Paenibacillus psychroresistens]
MESKINPEVKEIFSYIPEVIYTQENLAAKRNEMSEMFAGIAGSLPVNDTVLTSERLVPGADGDPDVRIKIYQPRVKNETLPGVLYIHGGGYILGSADMMDPALQQLVSELNCVIVSVDYRLAPEHPYPAPLDDCYAALQWFSENAKELGVDSARIAVVGPSAGGGLTAAVCLLARDRKGPAIVFQMPLYPMIDDRSMTKSSNEITDGRVWNQAKNQFGWEMYLGGKGEVSQYAAPARATDLSGLPPTYTCVGDLDPFRDETIDYVLRLTQAGVPTEFHLYPGCFHGFEEYFPAAEISQRIVKGYNE